MVPPLRLPGRRGDRNRTSVWLKLPEAKLRMVVAEGSGRAELDYPPGTVAVRIEEENRARTSETPRWVVADIRETRVADGNKQWFRVLRPVASGAQAALAGYEWARGERAAERSAMLGFADLLNRVSPASANVALSRLRETADCASCHAAGRPDADRTFELGAVHRGTDAAGFFQVKSVLSDHAPVEAYSPIERNLSDPAIEFRCGEDPAAIGDSPYGKTVGCTDGTVPIGYLDVRAGLARGDERVRGLCRSRGYLFLHLDDAARQAFREAFTVCGIELGEK